LAVETVLARASGTEIQSRMQRILIPPELPPTVAPPPVESGGETRPDAPRRQEADSSEPPVAPPPEEVERYDLERALETAFRSNRDMITRRESLYLEVLSLLGTRHSYNPQISALLATTFSDSEEGFATYGASFSPALQQRLRHGGSLSLSGSSSWSASDGFRIQSVPVDANGDGIGDVDEDGNPVLELLRTDEPSEYDLSATISFTQPLLRGFGHAVSHEALIQAERNLIYAVRDFELFREEFSIEVAERFYGLVEQKTSLANQRENLAVSNFQLRKAEALYSIGRGTQIDLFRAERTDLQDRNGVIQAEQAYELALDRFKTFLGIDIDSELEIVDTQPPEIEIRYDPSTAVEIAKANRLDYLSRLQQLEDSERALRLARDELRSDLNLSAAYSLGGANDSSLSGTAADEGAWSVGLSWDLPLDRVDERHNHRARQIAHQRILREFEQFDETLEIEIESSFRELTRVLQSIRIQETLIESQERNLKKAQIDYEAGLVDNREVVDAQQALTAARNGKIREQVNYEISRLRLLQDLGILFVDSKGMWMELE
jgi:outer membrane protein TolC